MRLIKKLAAVLLVAVMTLSICGCHKKNEIAVTVGDYEYTSAYYLCALINAYSDGQNEVYENLPEEQQQNENIDYFREKIDDKSFSDWVKDRAIEILKTVSYYKSACKQNKVTISDEEKQVSEYYASIMWQNYSQLFEPNGVSQTTFTEYFTDGAPSMLTDYAMYYSLGVGTPNDYEELLFQKLYGEKGEKEVSAKSVKKELYDNYIIADVLQSTFSDEQKDSDKERIIEQFKDYEKQLKSGKKTFKELYKEHNNVTNDNELPQSDAKDPFATIIDASNENYDKILKMDTDEIKLIESDSGVSLVIKKDIESDKYYLETLDMTLRHSLKDEEFQKNAEKEIEKLEAKVNNFALDRFKVKNIILPES